MMVDSFTIIFWVIFIFGFYFYYKYSSSRNKSAYLKKGAVRSFLYSLLIFTSLGVIIALILPNEPLNLESFKLSSEAISQKLSSATGLSYYLYTIIGIFTEINLIGFFCAGITFAIWFYYVRNIDFYKKEKIGPTIVVIILGILFSFFTFPVSDFLTESLNIQYSQNTFYNLFVYCFIKIGIVEELVKILPVFGILLFTNEVDEPVDLIYYACLSALGFAFIENLIYLRDVSGPTVVGRAFTAVVGHMIDTSIVVYGIIVFKFRSRQHFFDLRHIMLYFILGAFSHALYDYFLFENLHILFIASFILFAQVWFVFINNALNNSTHFNYSIPFKHDTVKFRMIMYLSLLIIIGFVIDGLNLGKEQAINNYVANLSFCGPLMIFYASEASSFDLFKGHWRKFKLTLRRPSENSLPLMRGWSTFTNFYTYNTIVPLNHVGKKIKLHCHNSNDELSQFLYIDEGQIIDRIKVSSEGFEDIEWFLVKLKTPFKSFYKDYRNDFILIKLKNKYNSLDHDKHILCWLNLIPGNYKFKHKNSIDEFVSLGTIVINGYDYEYPA